MKIGIEVSAIFRNRRDGVTNYLTELTRALLEIDKKNSYTLYRLGFTFGEVKADLGAPIKNVWRPPSKVANLLLAFGVYPPIDLLAKRNDVFIFPNFTLWPTVKARKKVVAVHDLAFIDRPEFLIPRHRWFLKRVVKWSVKRADLILTISEHSKKRISEHYGILGERITVANPAIDHARFKPSGEDKIKSVKRKYGIAGKYLLYLGSLEPRKNILGILRAYSALPPEIKKDYKLVLAGQESWLSFEIDEEIKKLGANVVVTGGIESDERPHLYSGATLFLYPSHYEGWGMQVIEAMACGTPVITARNSALPEAGGDAVSYIENSRDIDTLTRVITDLLNNAGERERMRERGLAHVQRFSWKRSAQILLDVIAKL